MNNKPRAPEHVQRAADIYLEMADTLEAQAKRYRETAKHYRAGALEVEYRDLPPDAGAHMRGPVQRAIDGLSIWTLARAYEEAERALRAITKGPKGPKTRADRAFDRHRREDPHCTCPDCIHYHANQTLED